MTKDTFRIFHANFKLFGIFEKTLRELKSPSTYGIVIISTKK